jgi:hypothetical protein
MKVVKISIDTANWFAPSVKFLNNLSYIFLTLAIAVQEDSIYTDWITEDWKHWILRIAFFVKLLEKLVSPKTNIEQNGKPKTTKKL